MNRHQKYKARQRALLIRRTLKDWKTGRYSLRDLGLLVGKSHEWVRLIVNENKADK